MNTLKSLYVKRTPEKRARQVFSSSSAALAVFDGDIAALKIFPQGADHRLCCC